MLEVCRFNSHVWWFNSGFYTHSRRQPFHSPSCRPLGDPPWRPGDMKCSESVNLIALVPWNRRCNMFFLVGFVTCNGSGYNKVERVKSSQSLMHLVDMGVVHDYPILHKGKFTGDHDYQFKFNTCHYLSWIWGESFVHHGWWWWNLCFAWKVEQTLEIGGTWFPSRDIEDCIPLVRCPLQKLLKDFWHREFRGQSATVSSAPARCRCRGSSLEFSGTQPRKEPRLIQFCTFLKDDKMAISWKMNSLEDVGRCFSSQIGMKCGRSWAWLNFAAFQPSSGSVPLWL